MLGILAAASVGDTEWRARLLTVAKPAFDALPGVWDARPRVAACLDAVPPTADDCLSLP